MKAFFRLLFLVVLAGTTVFLTACDSKSDVWPTIVTPQTGNLSGQVLPAFSATSVRAMSRGIEITVVPTENGEYHFKDLTAGQWRIFFTPAPGYDHRLHETVQVNVGSDAKVLPAFLNTSTVLGGWWQMDGKYKGACSVARSYQSKNLFFSFSNGGETMSVTLAGIDAAPFSFPLGGTGSPSQITFSSTDTGGATQRWTTTGGTGTVAVSVYGTNPRRVSGTFTCQAVPANSSTASPKQITGRFDNILY